MQGGNQASVEEDDFDRAIASLKNLVASARLDGQRAAEGLRTSDSEPSDETAGAAPEGSGTQPSGFGGYASGFQDHRNESLSSQQGRLPRLTDVLATGIHEVTQHVGDLIDANRAAHSHLFGPLTLPPRPGGTRPASSGTADGHLAGAMWQLKESIKELQDVSQALLTRL